MSQLLVLQEGLSRAVTLAAFAFVVPDSQVGVLVLPAIVLVHEPLSAVGAGMLLGLRTERLGGVILLVVAFHVEEKVLFEQEFLENKIKMDVYSRFP